jgi:hypothetical protein
VTVPARSGQSRDDIDALRARLSELESTCNERDAEVARTMSDLAEFRIRYRRDVGGLHEELEELERAIAEAELGEFAKRLEDEGSAGPTSAAIPPSESAPRLTSDAVRRLFRDVAKMIHPDLAADDRTRDRRHALMIEANRAYALGDEERLRMILDAWEKSPESVQGDDWDAARLRLERRIAQIEEQLVLRARELAELHKSPLWRLKAMVDAAEARGKDLIADQVRRLKRDITAARNRLDAMTL